ncbi:hypothetical protein ACVWYS_001400 [Arthrobacter sp. TE12231]
MNTESNSTYQGDSTGGQTLEFSESRKSFDSLFVSTPIVSSQSLLAVADSGNSGSVSDSSRE